MPPERFYTKTVVGIQLVAKTRREIDALVKALRLIRRRAPKLFRCFRFLDAVLVYPKRSYDNAIYMHDDPYVWVCESGTALESSPAYFAGLLVHEAVHVAQWRRGIRRHSTRMEEEAYHAQRRFLKNIGANDEVAWLDEQFKERWWVKGRGEAQKRSVDRISARHRRFLASYRSGTLPLRHL
ncbi:MAG: hypothetical protein A2Z88_08485 [Omnitrophica WOR_2 bacterium GWA2_47_8]|nr:MAG: hypothetical protein A2Z88_08485 [Omnitrophica WOR_2 bacterium GWA2_47_8]